MKTFLILALTVALGLALAACSIEGSGGIFCYEHEHLEGRWRRDADVDAPSMIRFDGQGYIVEADPSFSYLVGKRAQVDCGGEIHGDVSGEFINRYRIILEGLLWNKI